LKSLDRPPHGCEHLCLRKNDERTNYIGVAPCGGRKVIRAHAARMSACFITIESNHNRSGYTPCSGFIHITLQMPCPQGRGTRASPTGQVIALPQSREAAFRRMDACRLDEVCAT